MNDAISIPVERVCPRCGGEDFVPLVMGFPSPELFELAEQGRVVLGGCEVGLQQPDVVCRTCGLEWGSEVEE